MPDGILLPGNNIEKGFTGGIATVLNNAGTRYKIGVQITQRARFEIRLTVEKEIWKVCFCWF